MIRTCKGLALLLSVGMSLLTTVIFLILGPELNTGLILGAFITSLVTGFMLIHRILNRLIFREIDNITKQLENTGKWASGDANADETTRPGSLDRMVNQVRAFARAKQAEIDRLRKLEAFRKDFIADVSHELKTPIFAAQGFVHTLLDGAVKEKAVRKKFLKKAAKSLDGLDMLVQDLLTLSHIETGQIKMRFEDVDLYALTQEVFDQFRGKHNKKQISLRIEGPVRRVTAWGDRQRISQVMTNLVSNAINHSQDYAEVIVGFSLKKTSVVTRVTDFGEGIHTEHLHRIFERFYRVDKSRSREKGGTGLGLAIVKHILEGHNSRAEVESEPGKGSTFSFRLRRSKKADGDTERRQYGEDQAFEAES